MQVDGKLKVTLRARITRADGTIEELGELVSCEVPVDTEEIEEDELWLF